MLEGATTETVDALRSGAIAMKAIRLSFYSKLEVLAEYVICPQPLDTSLAD